MICRNVEDQKTTTKTEMVRHETSLHVPYLHGVGVGTETWEVDNVFAPDDLWFGSISYTNCAVLYNSYLDV